MNEGVLEKRESAFTALSLEYTPKTNSIFHLSFPLLIGTIRTRRENYMSQSNFIPGPTYPNFNMRDNDRNRFDGPKSLEIQAVVNLELNVYKYVKLFTGINYRLAAGKKSDNSLSGVSGIIGLKQGVFDQKIKKIKKK
jgi:hypothetical protein